LKTEHRLILLIIEDDGGRREIPLTEELYSIGRHPQSNILLLSPFIGRRCVTLVRQQYENGSFYYKITDDCNLSILIKSHDLENKDQIVFSPGVMAR
jgi:hypothetical protein